MPIKPLMQRFAENKDATLRRLNELDDEDKSGLAHLDPVYQGLRRQYESLEQEFDRQKVKQLGRPAVAIYGAKGRSVTSVAALSSAKSRKKAKAKPKPRRRFRFG